jgi:hypothetical protein
MTLLFYVICRNAPLNFVFVRYHYNFAAHFPEHATCTPPVQKRKILHVFFKTSHSMVILAKSAKLSIFGQVVCFGKCAVKL